ncbi:MAG: hypothetical protein HY537_16815 [Deltaproteobacteria bacterium]|nr:hypothetical protein [Deltaproteobacteria bacterium]
MDLAKTGALSLEQAKARLRAISEKNIPVETLKLHPYLSLTAAFGLGIVFSVMPAQKRRMIINIARWFLNWVV